MEPHKESLKEYNRISQWIAPGFFFSRNELWTRMGMLGIFGDYILSCTAGDILEIGVGESSIYLAALARKYDREIYHCDVSAAKIDLPLTVEGFLAPERSVFFRGSSDELFIKIKISPIALAFIDGDHNYNQVKKDFYNVVPYVVDDGFIFLHDTYPPDDDFLSENYCGTVYKLRQEIEKDERFDCITLIKGTAMEVGLTVCRKKSTNRKEYQL